MSFSPPPRRGWSSRGRGATSGLSGTTSSPSPSWRSSRRGSMRRSPGLSWSMRGPWCASPGRSCGGRQLITGSTKLSQRGGVCLARNATSVCALPFRTGWTECPPLVSESPRRAVIPGRRQAIRPCSWGYQGHGTTVTASPRATSHYVRATRAQCALQDQQKARCTPTPWAPTQLIARNARYDCIPCTVTRSLSPRSLRPGLERGSIAPAPPPGVR